MKKPIHILIVEDMAADADLAIRTIRKVLKDCEFRVVETRKDFLEALEGFQPDVILSDYSLPRFDGLTALKLALKQAPFTPLIIWTGSISEDVAVDCMKAGANNYILKENLKRLGPAVIHALDERQLLLERRQAEEKYQAIFENSPEGVFRSTPSGQYLSVNPAMARIYGYTSPEEMIASIQEIAQQIYVEPADRNRFHGLLDAQGTIKNFEGKNYRKEGSIIWTSTSARVVRDADGSILYYEGFLQDITERKQAESALQNSEKHFRALIENGLENISLLAADGTLLWESPAIARTLAYAPDEFVGRSMFELMHSDDLEWLRPMYTKLIQEPGGRQHGTFRLRHADGTWRWVEAIVTNMLNEPSVKAIVANYRDITERKQAEIELQQRNDDLALINALNEVINRGEGVDAVVTLMATEIKRIFSSEGTTIYLLSPDGHSLRMQQYFLSPEIRMKIEKVIGRAIPVIEIPIQEGGHFQSVLISGRGAITSDPETIQKWIGEFAETTSLPPLARRTIRKLIPQIYKLLHIKSTILIPLISDGKAIGLLDVSGPNLFTEEDLKRIEKIGGQLTTAIRRKQVEEELKEERNLLRILIDNLPDRIYAMDTQCRKTLSNSADWKASGGKTMEDVIGKTDFDMYPAELAEQFWQLDKAVIDSGQPVINYEEPGLDAEGNRVSILTTKVPLQDSEGKVIGLVGIGRDITERKQVEARINDLLVFNEKILNQSPFGILTYKLTGECVFANTNAASLVGTDVTRLLEQNYHNIEAWKKSGLYDLVGKAIATQTAVTADIHLVSTFGKDLWMTAHCVTFKSKDEEHILLSIADITERKRAEVALHNSESKYRTLVENSLQGIAIYCEQKMVYANSAMCQINGYTAEELMGMSADQIVALTHPDDRALAQERSLKRRTGETLSPGFEGRILKKDGTTAWLQSFNNPIEYDGKPALLSTVLDITERKKAEERLVLERNLLSTVIDNLPDYVFVKDLNSRLILDNIAHQRLLGATTFEEVLNKTDFDFFPEGLAALYFADEQKIIQSGEALINKEEPVVDRDGNQRWLLTTKMPLRDLQGTITGIVGINRDITEHRRAEEALRESENRLILALSGAQMSVWEWDLQTNGILWSPEFFEITGVEENDFGGTFESFTDLIHKDDVTRVMASAEKAVTDNSLFTEEFRIIRPNGEIRWLSNLGHAEYNGSGSYLRLIGTVQDITQRKQAEIERQSLFEITQGFANTKDLKDLLKLIHHSIARVIHAENFFVVLYQPSSGRFEEIYSVDQYDPPAPPARLEKSITSYVFRSGEPLLLTQTVFDALAAQGEVELVGTNSASWLGVPLKTPERTIGVMAVQDYENPDRYSEHDQDFLTSIAAQIALSIEHREAGLALRESEEHYRTIFEGVQDAIFVESIDGKILMVNERACEMFGYSQAEFLTKTVADLVPAGHPMLMTGGTSSLLAFEPLETVNQRANGEIFPIEISGRLQVINGETVLLVVVRDMTERKRAETALLESITQFRTLFEASPDAIILIDQRDNWPILDCNTAACQMNGYTHDELVGQPIDILNAEPFNPEGRAAYLEQIRKVGVFHQESAHRRKDGTIFLVDISTSLITLGGREVVLGIDRDITERKRAEQALMESMAQFRTLFEASPEAIMLLDPSDNFSIIDCNTASCQMNGYDRQELIGQCIDILNTTPGGPNERAEYLRRIQQYGILRYETIHRRKDGTLIAVEVSTCLIQDGKRDLVLGIDRDITERKRAEDELRASEERFRQLADNIQEVFWMTDAENGREIYMSPAAELIWERSLDSLMNEPGAFINSVFPEDQPAMLDAIERERNGEKVEIEYRILRPDGSLRWIWDRGFPIFDDSGRVKRIAGISADITERRESEMALIKSQGRYRELFDSSPISIWEEDFSLVKERIDILLENGVTDFREYFSSHPEVVNELASLVRITDVNQASLELYGADRKGYLLNKLTDIFDSETMRHFEDEIIGLMSPSRKFRREGADRTINGNSMEVIVNGSIPQGYEEDWSKVIVSVSDITDRKRAEEKLRESEQRYHSLFQNLLHGFALHEIITNEAGQPVDYVFLEINPAFERMTGLKAQDIVGRRVTEVLPGIENDTFIPIYGQVALTGESVHIDEYASPLGKNYEINAYSTKPGEFAVSFVDITERKKAEQQLRKLSRAVEQSASVIVITDSAGHIEYVNPKFTETTGYSFEEVIGQNPRILKSGYTSDEAYKHMWEAITSGQEWHGELLNRKKNGELFWEHATISPISNERGEITNFLAVKEDITQRKQSEIEIRRRAEETAALLETSLALTNLDLKATLQNISNSAKTLFAADGCRIFLMEPDGESLRCVLALQENTIAFSDLKVKIGDGVTGAVAASGQAEIVNEMQNDPRAVQVSGTLDEEEAIMFAPLKERDRTIGILSIRRLGTERPFQHAELELLEALASMAASAVSNARLFEETQRRLAELEALYENGLAVGRLLKPREIGERIIETFAHHLLWHHVTIRLKHIENDELELIAFNQPGLTEEEKTKIEDRFNAMISRVGQGMSGWAIHTGLPLRTGNVHAHSQYVDTHTAIQSGLYMPLKIGERVIGVISVESEESNAFSEQDERLLATLASQAAIAFENARLYEAVQKELSERKRAEDALRISETHYRELADSITDILFELDQNLRYTHWNKASEALTGIPARDAVGKSMYEIFGETEEQSKIRQIYQYVFWNRQPRTFETIMTLNEEKRFFEINAYPSTRGVSVVAKDVTNRKRSESIMQKRFELMEYAAHHTLAEVMQKTSDEVSELTDSAIGFFNFVEADQATMGMQTWSTNALQLFNVSASDGMYLPLDQAGVWAEALRQRRPLIQNDYEALSNKKGLPQGHLPMVREIVIPIIRNERIVAVMGVGNKPQDYTQYDLETAARMADYAWDITERKQMGVALEAERNQLAQRVEERTADLSRANSNLARALRVKDEFLANMSHELRTPLNAILGLSESLGEQIAGPLNEKQQKYIGTIGESGHHLLSLINDILDLAKIEAGQITLDINKVDIHSVCQASLRMVKQLAQKKNQEVLLEIDEGLGLMWADERRLKQMIVNLLGNAVKFTPENGKIGLEVHGDQDANKITITVWDNGIGIKEDDLKRLFQPFVQLDSGLARESTGTGLGLALVAQMARLHGGGVSAVSEPWKGSRFSIVVPWEPALALDTAARLRVTGKFRAVKIDEMHKPVILLVEDTREVTMMIRDYLEMAGYKVVSAQDGVDAIVQAKLVHPNLILMDVQMPRMDGLEATRKLRSDPDFRYTPIIALTALAMPSDRENCLAAGMDEYISKPINLRALVKIIQSCLFDNQESKS